VPRRRQIGGPVANDAALYTSRAATYQSRMPGRRVGALAWFVLVAACGSPQHERASAAPRSPAPTTELPELEGRPVFDRPLREASPAVANLWNAAHAMLADPLPAPPADADAQAFQNWAREVVGTWTRARRSALSSVQPWARELLGGTPREQLFATVVLATLYDDFANQVRTIPAPPDVASDPRARGAYREILDGTAAPLGRLAREGFEHCREVAAHVESPLDAWRGACEAHARSITDWLPAGASDAPSAR
jgi:hypothetical protein